MKSFLKNRLVLRSLQKKSVLFSLSTVIFLITTTSAYAQPFPQFDFTLLELLFLALIANCSVLPATESVGLDLAFTIWAVGLLTFTTFRRFRKK